jgi:hypothetical protein
MVAAQIHDADDRPEPRQHVGYRHLRTETVRWMKCARSNHKEEQMRNAGVHERCLQPAERLSSIFGRRSRLSPKVQRNNFLLLSSPLTTAIGTKRHFAAARKFGPFWIEADIAAGFMSTRPSTTLADLLRPPLVANPFSTMRASLRR